MLTSRFNYIISNFHYARNACSNRGLDATNTIDVVQQMQNKIHYSESLLSTMIKNRLNLKTIKTFVTEFYSNLANIDENLIQNILLYDPPGGTQKNAHDQPCMNPLTYTS